MLTQAPGNGAAIGGNKVTAAGGWFAARPGSPQMRSWVDAQTAAEARATVGPMPFSTTQAPTPNWSTSSFGHAAHSLPAELSALESHLHTCRSLSGPLHTLRCGVEAAHRFLAGRIVTTVVVAALLIGAVALLS